MKQTMMWRLMVLTMVLILGTVCGVAAYAEDAVASLQPGRLEVRGQAVRIVMPDTVTITIGATAQHDSEQDAYNQVNQVIASVMASLKDLAVPENQIKTSRLDISPRYSTVGTRRIIGYTASVSLTVTLKDFEMINTVIDTAVAHGANNVGGMRFSFSEEGLAYRQALADATTIAREKAEAMAAAAGAELGTVILLREGSNSMYSSYANVRAPYEADAAAIGDTQVMAGEIQISASVDLTFELK